jgi:Plasmid pRiA4b ORF-3-like protein
MVKPNEQPIYQLKITLKGARPPIWRRVHIPSDITLAKLHKIIQLAMGWYNCHLHEFEVQGQTYGQPMPEYDFDVLNEQRIRLNQFVTREKVKFAYLYDMGDSWDHEILVEKILSPDPETRYPVCIKGKRACPPEDCGGVWGYADLLAILRDPNHSEHEEMLEWVGGQFDSEAFDLEEANRQLERIR